MGGTQSADRNAAMRTIEAGKTSEWKAGEMKEIDIGNETKILVGRTEKGKFFSTSSKCPHYGAPLAKGVLCGERIMCPWHAAAFCATTGDIEDSPSLDALHSFDVTVKGGVVTVSIPELFPTTKRIPNFSRADPAKANKHFVVLGGGAAGGIAAETLRMSGFQDKVTLVTNESFLPYDRAKLSKALGATGESIQLRNDDFYRELDITVMRNATVSQLNAADKKVTLADGTEIPYTAALLATGGSPRKLDCPGHDLQGVYYLRTPSDANAVNTAATEGGKAVVIGTGFIGMEVAAYLKQTKKMSVTVIGRDEVPFRKSLGEIVGRRLLDFHKEKGTEFRMGAAGAVDHIEGKNGKVKNVVLKNGQKLPCDVVVVGLGVTLNTSFVKGVELSSDGSVTVDEKMKVCDGLYAAGDVARFKFWRSGEHTRIEHWDVAQQHGRIAAQNMAGRTSPYRNVPFFWSAQYGTNLRYAGHANAAALARAPIIKGDVAKNQFAAFYVGGKGEDEILAVATVGMDPIAAGCSELMRTGRMPSAQDLNGMDVTALLALCTRAK